ncbi:peptidase family C69 [Sinimarinibacterium sp. CAU 1509]|uniref:C69 family dipeptidase n=1 Tax=Sinimarinibacterium sp. CAU 1509 TaxID=2562283 RepID=UPI0010AC26A9|nr:C69 family dipeptidase [Sinimarinibacterium sp. CAU 1509]TJY62051.1 peptidase family C69 [Sinimarinibacterium sp. CAU 1509]
MCDTQVLVTDEAVWFAKNSDREPSEPQPVLRYSAVHDDRQKLVRVSHIEIEQVPDRLATILSQPVWCWGAEMGVNEAGVAIGNEAIFSKRASLHPGLLGMDLVRLGLERAATADAAIEVMTTLLERYGQGGAAGYKDQSFCYDSSFIVADAAGAWVLETAGRSWVARRVRGHAAISNALSIGADYERCSADLSAGRADFAAQFDTRLMPWFARSSSRRRLSMQCLSAQESPSMARFARHLRTHRHADRTLEHGSNADLCMHSAGLVRRHQTTGSLIAKLGAKGAQQWLTGTSAPCLSIFRPVTFDGEWSVLTDPDRRIEAPLWRRHEWLHRWALGDLRLRERLQVTRDEVEARMFVASADGSSAGLQQADRLAAAWHKVLWESLSTLPAPKLSRHWRRIAARDGIDPTRAAGAATKLLAEPTIRERGA